MLAYDPLTTPVAADVIRLTAELAEAQKQLGITQRNLSFFGEGYALLERDLAEARAANAALTGLGDDAARYQFLRNRDLDTIAQGGVFAGMTPDNVLLNGDDLDAAVDAARVEPIKGENSDE